VTVPALFIPLLAAGAAVALSHVEAEDVRPRFLQIWALSAVAHWAGLFFAVLAQRRVGAALLGPDGAQYLQRSLDLAHEGWRMPQSSISLFGTYDVGPYYLFGSWISLAGDGLVALQLSNAALGALVAPLTYSWARLVCPERATVVGVLVALYPTAIVLAVTDLLKDPAVVFSTVVGVWAVAHLVHGDLSRGRARAVAALGTLALAYLHVSRSYALLFLAAGAVLAGVRGVLTNRRPGALARAGVVAAMFLVADLALMPLGWPSSGQQLWTITQGVLSAVPQEGPATAGDALADTPLAQARRDELPALGSALAFVGTGTASGATAPVDASTAAVPESAAPSALRVTTAEYQALRPALGIRGVAADVVRKTLGPFVWVLPPDASAETLLGGDYLLYPGTIMWYALWPFIVAGLLAAVWALLWGRAPFVIGMTVIFSILYLGMYLAVNLSYRHRAALFPLMAVLAAYGWNTVGTFRYWKVAYGLYWLGLASIAAMHLIMRGDLG
jgi:hypothetical protein